MHDRQSGRAKSVFVWGYALLKFVKGHPNARLDRRDFDGSFGEKGAWSEVKYQKGREIFGEGEPADYVYRIMSGAVRTFELLADGRRQKAFHLPGDIFGIEIGDAYRFTAEAIVHTTVWIAKRRRIFGEGAEEDISATVLKLITNNLHHAENHVMLLGRQTALERLAAFLTEMDDRLQSPNVLILPMTRRDIGDYLGLSLETVSRTFSVLQGKELLSVQGGRPGRNIVLHRRSKLAQLALLRLTS
jgi:CRP/FNR family transcriptional regulator, nitrogen fixation regulation protein